MEECISSDTIINDLRKKGAVDPRCYKDISFLFADFQVFKNTNSVIESEDLQFELHDIIATFGIILKKFALELFDTRGNLCAVYGGFPERATDHASKMVLAVVMMQKFLTARNKYSEFIWNMKAGVCTGNIIAGFSQENKVIYKDHWNLMSKADFISSFTEPGRIIICQSTYPYVKDNFNCEYHGRIPVNENGEVDIYYVKSMRPGSFMKN